MKRKKGKPLTEGAAPQWQDMDQPIPFSLSEAAKEVCCPLCGSKGNQRGPLSRFVQTGRKLAVPRFLVRRHPGDSNTSRIHTWAVEQPWITTSKVAARYAALTLFLPHSSQWNQVSEGITLSVWPDGRPQDIEVIFIHVTTNVFLDVLATHKARKDSGE